MTSPAKIYPLCSLAAPKGEACRGLCGRRGFTLIELLVVMSIVALLVAILLPALAASREQAKRTQCASQLRQMGVAFVAYDQDNRQLPPGFWGSSFLVSENVHRKLRDGYGVVTPLTTCPSADKFPFTFRNWEQNGTQGRLTYHYFGGWGGRPQNDPPTWAIVDGWWVGPNYWYLWGFGYKPALFVDQNKFPSAMPMMMDLAYRAADVPYVYKPQRSNHINNTANADGENVMFLDAHVEWHKDEPGKTYRIGNDYYDVFYFNPQNPLPSTAQLW